MAHIGIDLGTSNTLVAYVNSAGEPEIKQIEGQDMVPSIIYIEDEGGNFTIGKAALDYWADPGYDDEKSFRRWKLKMGEEHVVRTLRIGGDKGDIQDITPEHLTTRLVEYVVTQLSRGLGGERIDSVLVTVPHGWRRERPDKCRATRLAAANARIDKDAVRVQEITVSEPVAAAAYWLWAARKAHSAAELEGKTFLVCDIGGGTFDISIVLVGSEERPLDVVDATNHDYAGDYTDALICAWVCKQFNQQFGKTYPVTAEEILEQIAGKDEAWLRQWFLQAQDIKQRLSLRAEQARGSLDTLKPYQVMFTDPDENHRKISVDLSLFRQCLEPFYAHGRELMRSFLNRQPKDRLPFAVAFAGGGSRIWGVRELVVAPVLGEFYNATEVEAVLKRLPINPGRLDQSIALGAALIANGVISVQERLLHDIGIVGNIDERLAAQLGLPAREQEIILTPILARGTILPASARGSDFGLNTSIAPNASLDLEVVIDDDSHHPWIQAWKVPHPGGAHDQSIEWIMEVDSDGVLTLSVVPRQGSTMKVQGRVARKLTGTSKLTFGREISITHSNVPRFEASRLRAAIAALMHK